MSDIFIYNQKKQSTKDKKTEKFFCLADDQEFLDDDNNPRISQEEDKRVLAKVKYKPNGSVKYLIKLDHNKKLFNPLEQTSEYQSIKNMHSISSNQHVFKEVNSKTFDFYLLFLKTKNFSWMRNAEREDI